MNEKSASAYINTGTACIQNGYMVHCCAFSDIGMMIISGKGDIAMGRSKKTENMEIGARLRESRINLGLSQAKIAEILDVTDDHYRKLESGNTGLTIGKLRLLYEELRIDPTYLLTGEQSGEFDLEKYLANCTLEQSDALFKRSLEYFWNMVQERKTEEE